MENKVTAENKNEFIGQIIDIFEDFLTEKAVHIDNPERDENDESDQAEIYGSDYNSIQSRLEDMMKQWKVFEE